MRTYIICVMNFSELNFLSTCKAIAILSSRCQNICVPINHCFSYDLIVDAEGVVSRIKVAQTVCQAPSGSYVVNIAKAGKEDKKKHFSTSMCDFLFVDTPDGCYLIPSSLITQRRSITLSIFDEYLIRE